MILDTVELNHILGGQNVLNKNCSYVLFGADSKGADLYELLREAGYRVLFFTDNDPAKQNKKFCALDVSPPSILSTETDCSVIITSAHVGAIKNQLNALGVHKVITPKIVDFAPFGRRKTILREIAENQTRIDQVRTYFADELSGKTFDGILQYCKTLDLEIIRDIFDSRFPQYFDEEIIKLGQHEVFVDGGSFDFGTSLQFIKKVDAKYKKIYTFEPDPVNFSKILEVSKDFHNVELINKGIYSERTMLKFRQNSSFDSMFAESGNFQVAVDCLDNVVSEPTFIKLDVEGSELSGLIGAKKIIEKYKPQLAVCVYHKVSDLWTIPSIMKEYYDGYKLYIRHYGANAHMEMVCYAVP